MTCPEDEDDECEAEWAWIQKELQIAPEDFLDLVDVIAQRNWVNALTPPAYLRTALRRHRQRRVSRGSREIAWGSGSEDSGSVPGSANKFDEVNLQRSDHEDYSIRDWRLRSFPLGDDHPFYRRGSSAETSEVARIDWPKWAAAAGMNDWEFRVLEYRINKVSRPAALSMMTSEVDRKKLQAAWRNFDRTGMARLKDAAKEKE